MKKTINTLILGLAIMACPMAIMAQSNGAESPVQVGDPAPNFTIKLPNGVTGDLSNLKGSVTVLDFWASWCPWCVKELPAVNAIDQHYDKVIVVGVDDEDAITIAKAAAQHSLSFQSLPDGDNVIGKLYGVTALPHIVVINAQGNVSAIINGYKDDNSLEEAVQRALTE